MALKTDFVEVEIQGDSVILRPARSVAGALAEYGKGKESFADVRTSVWNEVAEEKVERTP